MVKGGNWQSRIDTAQTIKKKARMKKIRKGALAQNKTCVQNQLWPLLEKFNTIDFDLPIGKLHLWVDTLPSSRDKPDDFEEEEDDRSRKNKKPMKKAKGDATPAVVKKVHPNSHKNEEDDDAGEDEPMLCHQYFFTGECQFVIKGGKSKKNNLVCKHTHYSKKQMTLADALSGKSNKQKKITSSIVPSRDEDAVTSVLIRASNAAALAQRKLEDDTESDANAVYENAAYENAGIDMLHHIEIPLISNLGEERNMTELVTKTLSAEKVAISGIAYVCYNDVLLFDIFDGGKVLNPETEHEIFGVGEDAEATPGDPVNGAASDVFIDFPATVHEHILSYLPDMYSGILPSVSTSLHREIGTNSPALWKALMQRHNWPMSEGQGNDNPTALTKMSFMSHYRVCGRVEALKNGMSNLIATKDEAEISQSTSVASFREHSEAPTDCRTICVWSETSVLVASRNDCSLRLYEASKHNSTNYCKQILGTRVAPVPVSKKTQCHLESVAVDDRYVVCSFVVDDEYVLTSIAKDDLLSNSTEDSIECGDVLRSHGLTSAFLEFYERTDKHFDFLLDFSDEDDYMDNVRVMMIDGLKACGGNGVFCALVKIGYLDENEVSSGMLSFSASKGSRIVLDYIEIQLPLSLFRPSLCSNDHYKKRTDPTELVCKNASHPGICVAFLDRNGVCQEEIHLLQGRPRDLVQIFNEPGLGGGQEGGPWSLMLGDRSNVHTVQTPSHIVTSYLLQNRDHTSRRAAFTFQSNEPHHPDYPPPSVLFLQKSYNRVLSMKSINREYLMVICYCKRSTVLPEEDIDGHWFGGDDGEASVDFIVVHVPSMSEIYSSSLCHLNETALSMRVDVRNDGTIAALIDDIGICLTGPALMNLKSNSEECGSEKTPNKKKKKRLVAKTAKKDGFSRSKVTSGRMKKMMS